MKDKISIDIVVHPLVRQWLENRFVFDGHAFDLGSSWVYSLVTLTLQRCRFKAPAAIAESEKRVPVRIYVTQYDADRYGANINLVQQALISSTLYKLVENDICEKAMALHVCGKVPRNTAIRYFLKIENLTDEELAFETIKKYYQRHYVQREKAMLSEFLYIKNEKHE